MKPWTNRAFRFLQERRSGTILQSFSLYLAKKYKKNLLKRFLILILSDKQMIALF